MTNLTILADSHQRPERHAHCRVRDDGVPVLQVVPIRAKLRQLRVVVQELEQDDDEVVSPRPDPRHCGHEQNKSANLGKRGRLKVRSTAQKTKTKPQITGKYPAREFISLRVFLLICKIKTALNYSQYSFFLKNSKTINLHHVKSVIISAGMVGYDSRSHQNKTTKRQVAEMTKSWLPVTPFSAFSEGSNT